MEFYYAQLLQTLGLPLMFISFERNNISTDGVSGLAASRLWLLLSSSLYIPSQYENGRQEGLLFRDCEDRSW